MLAGVRETTIGGLHMSNNNEQSMESRGNFASRLLSAAMNERRSYGGRLVVAPDGSGYATEDGEHHNPGTSAK